MPSPAINTVEVGITPGHTKQWPSWVPTAISNYNSNIATRVSALAAPATVVTTVRPDGSRPMAPWYKRWFRGVCKPQNWSVDNIPGRSAWCYRFTDIPAYTNLPQTTHTGNFWLFVEAQFPFTPTLEFYSDQVAKTAVLNKIGQKKWDLGVAAGELKQTAGLVTDLASGMSHQLLDLVNLGKHQKAKLNQFFKQVLKEGDFYKAAASVGFTDIRLLETLRDRWMQYQFGVKPILQDVDNAVNWLSDYVNQQNLPILVKAKAGHESDRNYLGNEASFYSGLKVAPQWREICQTHYSVVYEVPTGQVPAVTSLGLDNPYSIAWELTQLSWMFDYVLGVGDWLTSFSAANGLVFREGCKSVLRKVESTGFQLREVTPLGVDAKLTIAPDWEGSFIERGSFDRTLLASGITPGVVPQIKSSLGLVQLANSLFALSNVFSGRGGLR